MIVLDEQLRGLGLEEAVARMGKVVLVRQQRLQHYHTHGQGVYILKWTYRQGPCYPASLPSLSSRSSLDGRGMIYARSTGACL